MKKMTSKNYYKKYISFEYLGKDLGLTAPKKMNIAIDISKSIFKGKSIKIADIGGVYGSYRLFKKAFPKSEIWTVNIFKEQVKGCKNIVCEDISGGISLNSDSFDLIFCGDLIEHIVEPDGVLEEMFRILKKGGYLILTTPNLASFVNRVSLLFGFAPTNYHPSDYRYGTLFGVKKASWHKSVFTVRAMKEFLREKGFKVIYIKGFTYQKDKKALLLDKILPTSMKEGMIVLAQK